MKTLTNIITNLFSLTILLSMIFLLTGCSSGSGNPNQNLSVQLTPTTITIGESSTLTISLSNSIKINQVNVSIINNNPTLVSQSSNSCTLDLNVSSCSITLTGESSGIATFTIQSSGYKTITSELIITPNNWWTWIGGESTFNALGSYGTMGIPSNLNFPRSRFSGLTWVDQQGKFWLFGGFSSTSFLNDLWKYDPDTNQWTWVSGSTTQMSGVYGTKGIASSANIPGSRARSINWVDQSGNLWLFGGFGVNNTGTNGYLNDLWEYNPNANQWTWVSGSTSVNATSIYGTKGITSSLNMPGGRSGAVSFKDQEGNLWLFGGQNGFGAFNDLWKYSPTTNQWTWVSGESGVNSNGVYGTKGIASSDNIPSGKYEAISFSDKSGNFWLFSGASSAGVFDKNDLWKYNPGTNQWTWVSGESTPDGLAVYGTKGVANSTNIPGSRVSAVGLIDPENNLWVFGGFGSTESPGSKRLGDLWKYNPTTNQWTWVSGQNSFYSPTYQFQGIPESNNLPGSRQEAMGFISNSGYIWILGGTPNGVSVFSDFWNYYYIGN